MADSSSPSAPGMDRDSHSISKTKPRVRIIHVFAPKIIKTDVENFRGLVQHLTGKHAGDHRQKSLGRIRRPKVVRKGGPRSSYELVIGHSSTESTGAAVKREELGMWNAESSGGFLSGFEHLDGYVQELVEFPLLPVDHHHHRQASNSSSSSSQSTVNASVL